MSLINLDCIDHYDLDDMIRMVTEVDSDGKAYLRILDFEGEVETTPIPCGPSAWHFETILRAALTYDSSDGLWKTKN